MVAVHKPFGPFVIPLLLALASLGVFFLPILASAEAVQSFEFSVPPLLAEQPLLKSIRAWNNHIVIESEAYNEFNRHWDSSYYVVDLKTNTLNPLVIPGCSNIRSLADNTKVAFALCSNDQRLVLLSAIQGAVNRWNAEPLPVDRYANGNYLLVASENHLAMLSGEDIYWQPTGGKWHKTTMPSPDSMEIKAAPMHALLTNESLFLGFDKGEFGGGLVSIRLDALTTNPLEDSKDLSSMNVIGIVRGVAGTIWVAGGLSHLVGRRADLVMIKDGTIKAILNEDNVLERKLSSLGSVSLPGSSDISALCLDPAERPLILATRLGILEVSETSLIYRIKANFHISYKMPRYSVGSSPVGMTCNADGTILVATRSTGVLAFVKTASGYDFRQMKFSH